MKKANIIFLLLIAFLCGIVFNGCAFGTRRVSLSPISVQSGSLENQDVNLYVPAAEDLRIERTSVGCVRNGWGMRTAEVVSSGDVLDWVRQSISTSLKNSDVKVVTNEASFSQDGAILKVEVAKVFCESYGRYNAEVSLSANLLHQSNSVYRGSWSGTAANMNWAATSDGYRQTIEAAMRDCLQKMIPDLLRELENWKHDSSSGVQSKALFCPSCGAKLNLGATFCPQCGAKVNKQHPGGLS